MFYVTYPGAVAAGLLSFFTPYILPMVPFYLCYMAGISMSELRGDDATAPGAQGRLACRRYSSRWGSRRSSCCSAGDQRRWGRRSSSGNNR